ncbi:mandelate racemase/muconate lactonizing enzyme family protein [Microlunatus flavus]|uniref:D-galactarolactone cycloisomerase n=1 Tax=Microlunatus flavus TaxID=1036181 RepID=A0A1H9NBN8_9ACTN|nr:mandelate racemase/muconate lactonizing enzyme family protein [Microlunatus flavus]SER33460.1 D-galactarolactone cycloisomerase [Microlunatus flavus]
MKITRVTPLPLRCRSANGPMTFFVVRIETDDGLVGHGESCDCFGVSYPAVHAAVVRDAFAPRLVGRELTAVAPLVDELRRATRRELGESWASAQARSAVEIALWDLVGQQAGRSVSAILGRVRDSIPVYAGSSPFLDDHDAAFHLERLSPMLERGVRHVKLRTGPAPDRAVDVLADLRSLLGRDIEIMVDASESLDLPTTARLTDRMAELDVRWLEEPLLQSRHTAMAAAASRSRVPIAAGEHLFSTEEALAALTAREISVVQPDPCISGGIAEALQIAGLAAGFGARAVLHYHAGLVGLAAVLQVAASAPGVDLLEYPVHLDTVLRTQSGGDEFGISSVVDGRLALPDRPGLGVSPLEDVLSESLLA